MLNCCKAFSLPLLASRFWSWSFMGFANFKTFVMDVIGLDVLDAAIFI
jgi:hypothetical protein